MGYKVVVRFMDLEDNNFIYEVGWDFPRANHFVSQQRIKELSSTDNRQGLPLIVESGEVKIEEPIEIIEEPIVEPVAEEAVVEIIEEIKEEPKEEEPKEKPKKGRKKK